MGSSIPSLTQKKNLFWCYIEPLSKRFYIEPSIKHLFSYDNMDCENNGAVILNEIFLFIKRIVAYFSFDSLTQVFDEWRYAVFRKVPFGPFVNTPFLPNRDSITCYLFTCINGVYQVFLIIL